MRIVLKDESGNDVEIDEGESCTIIGTFYDLDDPQAVLGASSIATLKCWHTTTDGTVINSREDQDIKNTNGGSVDADGNFGLKLDPTDNAIIGSGAIGTLEEHRTLVQWTWEDDDGDTRTGRVEYVTHVRRVAA